MAKPKCTIKMTTTTTTRIQHTNMPHATRPHILYIQNNTCIQATTTTTTTTTTRATALDDYGNLLWQQEAAEFVEQFPQRRRPHGEHLQPSSSASALYKNARGNVGVGGGGGGGELLTTHQRHQRDLFSGDLGIPEIHTHVGSVVHTFETMALQRRQAEEQKAVQELLQHQQQQQPQTSKYLPSPSTPSSVATARPPPSLSSANKHQQQVPTATIRSTLHGTNKYSKYNQLKRKSHESRHKFLQLSQQQLLDDSLAGVAHAHTHELLIVPVMKLTNSCSTQTLSSHLSTGSPLRRSTVSLQKQRETGEGGNSNSSLNTTLATQYSDIQEDYRKNLFGTIPSRKFPPKSGDCTHKCHNHIHTAAGGGSRNNNQGHHNYTTPQTSGDAEDETIIVNKAFDEVFAGYSGVDENDDDDDDDDDNVNDRADDDGGNTAATSLTPGDEYMVSLSELDDDVFKAASVNNINILGRPGNTPKRIAPLTHKKGPPPPPPLSAPHSRTTNCSPAPTRSSSFKRRAIVPLAAQKQRSTTLTNIFERLKPTRQTAKRPLNKIPSDSLLKHTHTHIGSAQSLHKFPPKYDLHREIEGEEASHEHKDFIRGSTLSQSFVRQLQKRKSARKAPAPAPPVQSASNVSHRKSLSLSTAAAIVAPTKMTKTTSHNILHLPKRSKSSNELLLDDLLVETRKYYQMSRHARNAFGVDGIYTPDGCADEMANTTAQPQRIILGDRAEI